MIQHQRIGKTPKFFKSCYFDLKSFAEFKPKSFFYDVFLFVIYCLFKLDIYPY